MKELLVENSSFKYELLVIDSINKELLMGSIIGEDKKVKGISKNLRKRQGASARNAVDDIREYRYSHASFKISPSYDKVYKKMPKSSMAQLVLYKRDKFEEDSKTLTCLIIANNEEDLKARVFDKLYKNTAVPLLENWMDYIVAELLSDSSLRRVSVIQGEDEIEHTFKAYRLSILQDQLLEIIQRGVRQDRISVCENKEVSDLMEMTTGLDSYLNLYGDILAERIQESFVPKFDPDRDDFSEAVNNYDDACFHNGVELYKGQKVALQACVNSLQESDAVFVIGEMGIGKTIIGSGITYSHFNKKAGLKAIVLCPSHLTSKWKREVESYVPNANGYIVKDFSDLKKIENKIKYPTPSENVFVILSKETAKSSYELMPAVNWSISKNTFTCPCCGMPLKKRVKIPRVGYEMIPFEKNDMMFKKAYNERCQECKTKLWQPSNKNGLGKWLKLGKEGWVMQKHLDDFYIPLEAKEKLTTAESGLFDKLIFAKESVELGNPARGLTAPRKYSMAKYIKDNLKFDYSLIDEIHEYKGGSSAQGNAMADIVRSSKKMIGLTGTLLNGYADGLFYILYRAFPRMMQKEGFEYCDEGEFTRQFGVVKKTNHYVRRGNADVLNGTGKEKKLPGVSPLVFTKFLLENAVFLSLADLDGGLPAYREIPLGIEMDTNLRNEYEDLERRVRSFAFNFTAQGSKLMGQMPQILGSYVDTPFGLDDVVDKQTDEVLVEMKSLPEEPIRNKESELLKLVKEKLENNEKVLIYCQWTESTDILARVQGLLKSNDIDSFVLKSSVSASEREAYINREVGKGKQVMICNPKLVETGLDLLEFTTIVFYQMGYNIFTMRQASRRSWRLSQTKDIEVYFMYYNNTIQETAMGLMATKLQASMAIEGNMGEEGLRALSNNEDLLSQIASAVVEGIKDNVETTSYIVERTERSHDTSRTRTPLQLLLVRPPVSYSLKYLRKPENNSLSKAKTKTMKNFLNDVNILFSV